jgi:DNA-directed RNA polymerase subunit RPC12/RpoP
MYSPQLADDLITELYLEAKRRKKPMTKVLNDIVRFYFSSETVIKHCLNCRTEVTSDHNQNTGFCEFCDSEVFIN